MRKTTVHFSATFGRLLILLLVVATLATCFTGCFTYDPLGKEQGTNNGPAFDPDGDDEPDQLTEPTDPTDSTEPITGTEPVGGNQGSTETTPPTDPTQPATEPTEPATQPTQPTQPPVYADPIAYGMVTATELNIRKGPGTDYDRVGAYYFNTRVTIYARNGKWGQTKDGWISMDYVYVDGTVGNMKNEKGTLTGDYVNVRSGPGTEYGVVRSTREGDRVTVLHKVTINGKGWYCIADGWISADYVQLDKDKPAETEPATGGDDNTDTDTGTDPGTDTGNDTGSDTTAVDVTGTWSLYHISDGKLRVEEHIFKANGRYTNSVSFYEEVDETSDSNLTYDGKYWFGEPFWGWDGSYSVSGSTVTMVLDAQDEFSGSTIFGSVSGNTLTVNNITFTKE